MQYWLMKSEPGSYSIDDLVKQKITCWEGVRNYQARNFMRDEMRIGDKAFFYHSSCKQPGIVGIVEVVKQSYPDFTAFDPESKYYDPKSSEDNPRWFMVDVKLVKQYKNVIGLKELKQVKALQNMLILRPGNRLSITPVTTKEWQVIQKLNDE